jgi:hypothetical protein
MFRLKTNLDMPAGLLCQLPSDMIRKAKVDRPTTAKEVNTLIDAAVEKTLTKKREGHALYSLPKKKGGGL